MGWLLAHCPGTQAAGGHESGQVVCVRFQSAVEAQQMRLYQRNLVLGQAFAEAAAVEAGSHRPRIFSLFSKGETEKGGCSLSPWQGVEGD